ncbi:Protein of unknown function (DUF2637) [Streptomyces sp. Ncost-T6T-1]|uniref:DUF2637 domain-containing protein n=1 Tax=Streptomyces sp. Ncost-T6T-1 TaxID=1100828 RepID=UPI00080558CA|nr:DUF2637 domain-containing protein [Streptomyces sp. Ncost-T6T-1]SBU92088.1 Protein of unknown function (DUF2637) [Streptomyces sp. Ncost-T6T-1]
MTTTSAPKAAHISGWDRAAVIALGGAGCALSYDALQQMAVAIHIRGLLTFVFPLVIDGFIAYGVRALLVLRDAPLRARLYVWTLVGTATAASIWANALHAVRINQDAVAGTGLRLGDTVVAVLSTIAPLALAGAVHLYILIARGPDKGSDRENLGHPGQAHRGTVGEVTRTDRVGQQQSAAGQVASGQPVTALTDRTPLSLDKKVPAPPSLTGDTNPADSLAPVTGHRRQPHEPADLPGQPGTGRPVTDRAADPAPVTDDQDSPAADSGHPVTQPPVTDRGARTPGGRRPDPDTEELLKIARSAVRTQDKLTRKVVAEAIRGQQIPLSSDTLTALMAQLREQHRQPVTAARP